MVANVKLLGAFIESAQAVLSIMADTNARPGRPKISSEALQLADVVGVIGLAGDKLRGSLAIAFSEPCILHIASEMLGERKNHLDEDIIDIVAEIANMVLGNAKLALVEQGLDFELALPTTITGEEIRRSHLTREPAIIVPFSTEHGEFSLELCLEN